MLTSAVCKRYNIQSSTLTHWIWNLKENRKNQAKTCRPLLLEEEDGDALRVAARRAERNCDPTAAASFELKQYHQQVTARIKRMKVDPALGCYDTDTISPPCRNTIKKYHQKYRLFNRGTQALTEARHNAMSDIRLIFTTAVFVWALALNKQPHLIWNVDATTFECRPKGNVYLRFQSPLKPELFYFWY